MDTSSQQQQRSLLAAASSMLSLSGGSNSNVRRGSDFATADNSNNSNQSELARALLHAVSNSASVNTAAAVDAPTRDPARMLQLQLQLASFAQQQQQQQQQEQPRRLSSSSSSSNDANLQAILARLQSAPDAPSAAVRPLEEVTRSATDSRNRALQDILARAQGQLEVSQGNDHGSTDLRSLLQSLQDTRPSLAEAAAVPAPAQDASSASLLDLETLLNALKEEQRVKEAKAQQEAEERSRLIAALQRRVDNAHQPAPAPAQVSGEAALQELVRRIQLQQQQQQANGNGNAHLSRGGSSNSSLAGGPGATIVSSSTVATNSNSNSHVATTANVNPSSGLAGLLQQQLQQTTRPPSNNSMSSMSMMMMNPSASASSLQNATAGNGGASSSQSLVDQAIASTNGGKPKKKRRGRVGTFPQKMHQMLEDLEAQGKEHIASFVDDGKAFLIHDPDKFAKEVMPQYFKMGCYASFQRQLNLYEFQRVTDGPSRGAYFHPKFVRHNPLLSMSMKRNKNKGQAQQRRLLEQAQHEWRQQEEDVHQTPSLPQVQFQSHARQLLQSLGLNV